jgi:membrane-associated protein
MQDLIVRLIETYGYWVFFIIIFAESGLFFGFFLPGDSLLFSLALISRTAHILDIRYIILIGIIAAITGDSFGYFFGRRVGQSLFDRPSGFLFNRDNLHAAKKFYDEKGPATIVISRFTPFIRTFAPIVAGAAEMKYRVFLFYNVIGGAAWIIVMSLFGYFLGSVIPDGAKYSTLIVIAIIAISLLPTFFHIVGGQRKKYASKKMDS